MRMPLCEHTTGEARGLAGSVFGHIDRAGDRAGGSSTLSVEEDQEDQCTDKGETTNHTDHNTGDGATTQLAAARCRCVG